MPLPKLKYTREQLEAVRVAVAANGYKMPKAMPVASASPSGALRAEDLEKGLTKGQDDRDRERDRERRDDRDRNDRERRDDRDRRDTRDDRRDDRRTDDRRRDDGDRRRDDRGRDDRDYRQRDDRQDDRRGGTGRPAEDWGTRGSRNRNREAFEEGYEYELQMKAQKKNILDEAIKAEEIRVAEQKRREAAERAIKDEKESVEKALQIEEEHEKIYEAQQMFGVLSAEETVFSANKNAGKKASRFDFGGDDEEEKKPKVIVDDSVKLDPFVGVQVSSAVHNPKAQQQTQQGGQGQTQQQQGNRGAVNNAPASRQPPQQQYVHPPQQPQPQQQHQQYQGHQHQQQNQHGQQHHQQQQASHSQQQHNQNRGGKQNQNQNSNAHHGQQHTSAGAPQQSKPQPGGFVDPCIVSMSSDVPNVNLSGKQIPNPAPAQANNSSQQHNQQRNNQHHQNHHHQQQQQQKNSDSVTALFANAKTTKAPSNVPMQAVDASQLESQLLAKQQAPSQQAPNQHRHSPTIGSAGVGVPPTPIMVQMPVAPTSPPQKAASPPPYNAKPMMPAVAAAPQVMQSYVYVPQQAYGMRQVYIPQQFPYAMHPGQPQPQPQPQGNPQGRH